MTHTSVLQKLQDIDSQLDARRARLDEINALLGENAEVRAARERLAVAEEHLRGAQGRTTELELEIASLEAKTKANSKRLYSGMVTNPKELQDMEQELESLGRRHETLDESLLEAMVKLEEAQGQQARSQAQLKEAEARWTAGQGDLAAEKQDLEARVAELEGKREAVLPQVDVGALEVYERLRAERAGLAVVTVRDGVCSACGVAPTSTIAQKARHGELDARCPTCGRILFDG